MEKNTPNANTSYKKSSFGPAFFFLSKRQRTALAAYYEFCRLMDDLADEPGVKDRQGQLLSWQEEVVRMYHQTAQTDLGKQLAQVVTDFSIPPDRFALLIEGMLYDVNGKTYQTMTDLADYIYRVAVVVGLATLDILGIKGPKAESLAENLGSAVQLTNIIRDVAADAQLGRVYLPTELLARYQVTREEILAQGPTQKLVPVLAHLDKLACDYYAQAGKIMRQLPRVKMLPCRMMGCVYARNLAKIRKTGFSSKFPVKLTKPEKLVGVLHAFFQTLFA